MTMCDHLNDTFDETEEKHGEVWIVVKKQYLRKTAAHDNLVTGDGDEDRARLSTKAVASSHTIVAKVLYVIKSSIMGTSLGVEFLTMRVRALNTNEWEKVSHLMEYSRGGQDQSLLPGGKNDERLM